MHIAIAQTKQQAEDKKKSIKSSLQYFIPCVCNLELILSKEEKKNKKK